MRRLGLVLLLALGVFAYRDIHPDDYPELYRSGWTENYFGQVVSNNYHRLYKKGSPTLDNYLRELNKRSEEYLRNDQPEDRKIIEDRVYEMHNSFSPQVGCPMKGPNDEWFTPVVTMSGKSGFLYRHKNLSNYNEVKFMNLDRYAYLQHPNLKFSPDGTHFVATFKLRENFALYLFKYNRSAEFLTYESAIYKDAVYGIPSPQIVWFPDSSGFFHHQFYTSQEYKSRMKAIVFRSLRDPLNSEVVFRFSDQRQSEAIIVDYDIQLIHSYRLILGAKYNVTEYTAYWADLSSGRVPKIVDFNKTEDARHRFPIRDDVIGEHMYFISSETAPNTNELRRFCFDCNVSEIIVEGQPHHILDGFHVVDSGRKILLEYRNIHEARLMIYDVQSGTLHNTSWSLPDGTIYICPTRPSQVEIELSLRNFHTPASIYSIHIGQPNRMPRLLYGKDVNRTTEHKYIHSVVRGENNVVMTLIYRNGRRDRNRVVLLHGYGGFGLPANIRHDPLAVYMVDHLDAIVAYTYVRGGSDLGGLHHRVAMGLNKTKSYDDFEASAEFLITENFTNPSMIVSMGGSNGGLMVAASAFRRPDLFGAVLPLFGVMDMLRYSRYSLNERKRGVYWADDYGLPDTKESFNVLVSYSPVEQAKRFNFTGGQQFPATFFVTGKYDDVVPPAHTAMVVAEFYHRARESGRDAQRNPVIAHSYMCGHYSVMRKREVVTMVTDELVFVHKALRLDPKQNYSQIETNPAGMQKQDFIAPVILIIASLVFS